MTTLLTMMRPFLICHCDGLLGWWSKYVLGLMLCNRVHLQQALRPCASNRDVLNISVFNMASILAFTFMNVPIQISPVEVTM